MRGLVASGRLCGKVNGYSSDNDAMANAYVTRCRRLLMWACLPLLVVGLSGCDRYLEPSSCANLTSADGTGAFEVSDDGVARNLVTGTRWFRCSAGQRFVAGECRGEPLLLSLEEAVAYAEEFSQVSGRRWRLPTLAEMDTLASPSCQNPYLSSQVFPGVLITNYWAANDADKSFPLGCVTYTYNGNQHCRQHREEPGPFLLVVN